MMRELAIWLLKQVGNACLKLPRMLLRFLKKVINILTQKHNRRLLLVLITAMILIIFTQIIINYTRDFNTYDGEMKHSLFKRLKSKIKYDNGQFN